MSQNSFSRNSCRPTNNRNQCEKWDAANIQKSAGHSFLTHRNVLLWLQTQTDYKLIKQLWQNVFSWATGPACCVRQRWSVLPSLAPILRVTISKFLSTINHSYNKRYRWSTNSQPVDCFEANTREHLLTQTNISKYDPNDDKSFSKPVFHFKWRQTWNSL